MFLLLVGQAAAECTCPSYPHWPVLIASSANSNDTTTPGSEFCGEALLLPPTRFSLKVEHFHIHLDKYSSVLLSHLKNKMYHLSGTNAEKGHCESLQYNGTYAKIRLIVSSSLLPHCSTESMFWLSD